MADNSSKCAWCMGSEMMQEYHDAEWGFPKHDDTQHFEFLILEAAQAGLSWSTILKRRGGYKKAFAHFDPAKVSKFDGKTIEKLMKDKGIIRNRLKITAVINNAKPFIAIQKEFGSFDKYIWGFSDGKQIVNNIRATKDIQAKTALSDIISADLKKRGFSFVGSTIIYSHLQAVGVVNDHENLCFRKDICKRILKIILPDIKRLPSCCFL